jgi:hypothetical protein
MLLISSLYEVNFNIVLKLTSYIREVKNLFIPCLSLENMVNSVNKHIPKK